MTGAFVFMVHDGRPEASMVGAHEQKSIVLAEWYAKPEERLNAEHVVRHCFGDSYKERQALNATRVAYLN